MRKEKLTIGKPLGADRGIVAFILYTLEILTTSTLIQGKNFILLSLREKKARYL